MLFHRYTLQMLRNPVWLFVGFSTPILYLALFTPLLKHVARSLGVAEGQRPRFLPARASCRSWRSRAGASMGFGTIFELQSGVIERFRVTPASRFAILIGPILSGLMMMLVFDSVVVAVGYGFGFQLHWLGLLVLAVLLGLLAALMAAFSIATALVTKDISSFAAIINGLNLPMLLLAGVLLPDLARTAVDAGARALQPALLPRPGLSRRSPAGRSPTRPSGRRSPSSCRCARSCSCGRPECSARRSPERPLACHSRTTATGRSRP